MKKAKRMGLELTTRISLSLAISISVLGGISMVLSYNEVEEAIIERSDVLVTAIHSSTSNYLQRIENFFIAVSRDLSVRTLLNDRLQPPQDDKVQDVSVFFSALHLMNNDGLVVYTQPQDQRMIYNDMSSQPYFIRGLLGLQWSPTIINPQSGLPAVVLSGPVDGGVMAAFLDLDLLKNLFEDVATIENVRFILTDNNDIRVVDTESKLAAQRALFSPDLDLSTQDVSNGQIDIGGQNAVYISGQKLARINWSLYILEDASAIANQLVVVTSVIAAIFIFAIIFNIAIANRFIASVTQPLNQLSFWSKQISIGHYETQAPESQYEELIDLTKDFQLMVEEVKRREERIRDINASLESMVDQRTKQLVLSNQQLTQTINDLQNTKVQLVQAEKVASLTTLVAGVSHELNTPLGTALTAITYIQEMLEAPSLSKEEGLAEAAALVTSSLKRSINLLSSFKQLTQESDRKVEREVNVASLIKEAGLVALPNNSNIKFSVDLPEQLQLISYPGALVQITEHLVGNSVAHGFKNRNSGTISISGWLGGGTMTLEFRDDGIGMDRETVSHIFEPFFTTQRGDGQRLGLGLTVVFNLVRHVLGGSIHIESNRVDGTVVVITFPVEM